MSQFIICKNTYDPKTEKGLGEKVINVDDISNITLFNEPQLKRIKSSETMLTLRSGEKFYVVQAEEGLISTEGLIDLINRNAKPKKLNKKNSNLNLLQSNS